MIAFTWTASTLAAVASSDKSSQLFGEVLPWLILLAGFVIVGGIVIMLVRRWMASDGAGGNAGAAGFTLQDLRELHARGELTDEQFNNAKVVMTGQLKSSGNAGAANASTPRAAKNRVIAPLAKSEDTPPAGDAPQIPPPSAGPPGNREQSSN